MDNKGQSFFSKVSTRRERERAFVLLVESKSNIDCQTTDKKIFSLKSDHIKDSELVVFCEQLRIQTEIPVILTFNIGQEKYFAKTTIKPHDLQSHFRVNLEADLFKLQRRNSFRVAIPQGYNAKTSIIQVDDKSFKNRKFPLFDISGGGFSFEIQPDKDFDISQNQIVLGVLEIGGKFTKNFKAVVRHAGKVGSQGSGLRKIGLEFQEMKPKDQEDIVKVVMDIHRDMFSKFKIGSR